LNIDRIWGSIFSYENGKYIFKWPKVVPYPVTVSAGNPMPATSKVYEVRSAVQELAADAFKYRDVDHKKIHIALIDEAKKHPFKFCMADSLGIELNYAKLLAGIIALSKKLFPKKDDKMPNEMVGVLLPSSCAAALTNGAIYFAGKIPVNLNFTASKESIEYAVKLCSINKIITSKRFLEKINFSVTDNMVFIEDVASGVKKFEKILAIIASVMLPAFLLKMVFIRGDRKNIYDVATVIFSSGSTGRSKGVMLSHANITSNFQGLYQILNAKPGDVVLGVLPFFHALGFTGTLCLPIGAGIGVVYHANPLDAGTIGKLAEKYKATIVIGTPTFLSSYTRKCTKEQFKNIRFAMTGAEKLKRSIADAFYEKFNIIPLEGYGATELSPIVSLGIPDYISEAEHIKQKGFKEGTVGHPLPGVAIKVVDPDTYKQLPPNIEGLLLVKGSNVMLGYLKDEEKTKEVIKDGWYITGDIAKIDDDGFLCITDRLSRFSKIGGEMVPHIKIEEVVQEMIGQDDATCVVTSASDEKKGERLVVLYKGEVDIDKIWKSLNESAIPKLWIPKRESFYKIDEIPLLGSGKADLKKIKEMAAKLSESEKGIGI
jgi:acyl-[acyl-carrier-protein]-phospholipid O-acyltransferase/long-chain-fatty-acid--[acyl-carrier-protein] ligase